VSDPEIRVVEDPAGEVATLLEHAAAAGGHVVLTGGSSPRRAYEIAAERDADWSGATAWFGDDRCVAPDHPDSNFAMADRALLSRLSKPPQVRRIQGELEPDAAAGDYEAEVRAILGGDPRWDLLLLGVGPDGHTASLFPGKPEIDETARLVVPVPLAGMEPQVPRVTLTLPLFNTAREVVFLISGADKAPAVKRAFGAPPDESLPSALVRPGAGTLLIVMDEPAAAELIE
jgi:6-phosphogluconolactonase